MITVDFKRLNIKPGYRILDIGCGEGRHIAKAWEYPGAVCIGADMSHDDLLKSKEKLTLHEAFLQKIKGNEPLSSASSSSSQTVSIWALSSADITTLPFSNQTFDIIICSEVLEHIPDEQRALSEIRRVMKPGGTLVVSVPRAWSEKLCWKLSWEYHHTPGGHIRIYRKNKLQNLAINMGFRQIGSYHYAHGLHTPYWWLKCVVGLNRTDSMWVNLYHRILVWDLMKQPLLTRIVDKILNPVVGKSVVFYFEKP